MSVFGNHIEELEQRIAALEAAILNAHDKVLPASWGYTDFQTTLDLLVAEIMALRAMAQAEIDRFHSFVAKHGDARMALEAENTALRADRERLDFMEQLAVSFSKNWPDQPTFRWSATQAGPPMYSIADEAFTFETLRESVDAAMKESDAAD